MARMGVCGVRRLLSLKDAAELLGRTPGAVRELVYRGKLPVVRLDRRLQFDVLDLERVIQERKEVTPEELR